MTTRPLESAVPRSSFGANPPLLAASLALCLMLAIHVSDEALTGFLSVYNPTVLAVRRHVNWFPMPVFSFDSWLAGLIVTDLILFSLSWFVARGARWMRPLAY